MDADARALLELLKPAVDRAEQIEARQQTLLQRQVESAEAFTAQLNETTLAAEAERARLLEAQSEFDALRAAEVVGAEKPVLRQVEDDSDAPTARTSKLPRLLLGARRAQLSRRRGA